MIQAVLAAKPLLTVRCLSLFIASLLCVGCSAAKHMGPPLVNVPKKREPPVTVILEPFFEQARLVVTESTRTATVTPMGPLGPTAWHGGVPRSVAVTERVEEKPLLARVATLTDLHSRVLFEVKRRRPEWNVQSTGALTQTEGPVTIIRTIVGNSEIIESNRSVRTFAFGFGLVIWPLLILAAGPVEETERVYGMLYQYDADAEALTTKLIRYPTQPDFAVDTRGLKAREQRFGLDIRFEEGLFAPLNSKDPVLIDGFALQLAGAVIAITEGY